MEDQENEEKALTTLGTSDVAPMDFLGSDSGFEEVDRDCLTIPYLRIGQSSSDFMKRGAAKFIPGLQGGDFFFPLTREVFGTDMNVVIVKFYRSYSVYESSAPDAKFMGVITKEKYERDIEPTATRERSYTLDPDGHRYVDNRNFVLVDYDHPERGPMLFSMSSTGVKPSKNWLTQATNVKVKRGDGSLVDAPIWSSVWRLHTEYFDNPQGGYYQVSEVRRLGWVKTGPVAEGYRKIFESMRDYDATKIGGQDSEAEAEVESAAAEPVRHVERHDTGRATAPAPASEKEELF